MYVMYIILCIGIISIPVILYFNNKKSVPRGKGTKDDIANYDIYYKDTKF